MSHTAPRILLFTGKGGVGKTTTAAATAALAAAQGRRVLVVSTDTAHSLADAFGLSEGSVKFGSDPVEVSSGLFVQQVDAQLRFETSWRQVQGYLRDVLDAAGVDPITADELTVLPGAEEVLALLELRRQVMSGQFDTVVVDCAPTAETLRLLALPEALNWYMERVFPAERRIVKALRPVLAKAAGVPMPTDVVFDAVERLHAELADVHRMLTAESSSIRIVLTPEQVVLAEARRTLTTLCLYGYRVDGVVANRVFPTAGDDEWRNHWVRAQAVVLDQVRQSFEPLLVRESLYRHHEPIGVAALLTLAQDLYADEDPMAMPATAPPITIVRTGDSVVMSVLLPLATKAEVDVAHKGSELFVTVGAYRRVLAVPQSLQGYTVSGARFDQERLRVRFTPHDAKIAMAPTS